MTKPEQPCVFVVDDDVSIREGTEQGLGRVQQKALGSPRR
jgi:FixJ family two-component response regulator